MSHAVPTSSPSSPAGEALDDAPTTPAPDAPPPSAEPSQPALPRLKAWKRWSFLAVQGTLRVLAAVLTLPGLYRFGQFFGTLEFLINYKRRRRFHRALSAVLGRAPTFGERLRHTHAFFCRSRCGRMFFLVGPMLRKDRALDRLTITRRDLLDAALARGRGVYLALSHHGDHHSVGMLLWLAGYPIAGVRDRDEGPLRLFVQECAARRHPDLPLPPVLFADAFPRQIYRCLADGRLLISLMDVHTLRHDRLKTHTVRVFGVDRPFVIGPLQIALRSRAPVIQAFLIAESNFRYRLEIVDMLLDPDAIGDAGPEAAITEAVEAYAGNLETYVRQTPSLISRV